MPADDIYELSVDAVVSGQNVCNVHHFKQVGSDGSGDARASVIDMWQDKFRTKFLACLSTQYVLSDFRCRRISPTTTQSLIVVDTNAGGIADEHLPTQACAVLRQYATPLGRRGTGHVKLSGITQGNVQSGRISSGLTILINAFGDVMQSAQSDTGAGFDWRSVVWSLVDSVAREVISAKSVGVVKTVRSRQIGVGQ